MNALLVKLNQGTYQEPSQMTLKQLLNTRLNDYIANSLRKTTAESYVVNIEKHIIPALGHVKLKNLQIN